MYVIKIKQDVDFQKKKTLFTSFQYFLITRDFKFGIIV